MNCCVFLLCQLRIPEINHVPMAVSRLSIQILVSNNLLQELGPLEEMSASS